MPSIIRKILNRKTWLGIVGLLLLGLLWQLFWGRLFPFAPVALGFEKLELPRIVVYAQPGAMAYDYSRIEAWLPEIEEFHALQFIHKPRIYFFRDNASYLQRNLTRARFCAYPNNRLAVSPWAQKEDQANEISLEIYLKHELSHTLLYQHMSLPAALRYPEWLMEGIAVYSSHQMGTSWYPGQAETYNLIRRGNFMPPKYFKTKKEDQIALQVPYRLPFMYSEFACVVDYLIALKGKDLFLDYMQRLLAGGEQDRIFKDLYGMEFSEMIGNFKQLVETSPSDQPGANPTP